jgi:hypothetical protein
MSGGGGQARTSSIARAAPAACPSSPSSSDAPDASLGGDKAQEPPKLDLFEGHTDEIATVFDGPARKQSYRKSKSSLRYLLIRADVAKLWYLAFALIPNP